MSKTQVANPNMLETAGKLLVVLGLILCSASFLAEWNSETKMLVSAGVVHIVFGFLLIIKQYWTRYFAFIFALVSTVAAYIVLGSLDYSNWLIWAYIIVDFVIICLLFISIWNGRVDRAKLAN